MSPSPLLSPPHQFNHLAKRTGMLEMFDNHERRVNPEHRFAVLFENFTLIRILNLIEALQKFKDK